MNRSLLPPIRTRRYSRLSASVRRPPDDRLSAGTRQTVAAIGALLVSFAFSAAATPGGGDAVAVASDLTTAND